MKQISWKNKEENEVCIICGKYLVGFNHSECEKENKPLYTANGKHFSCYYDDMFYETLGDDFKQDDCIVVVEVEGENFKTFSDTEDKNQAYLCASLLANLGYNKLCVSYGATWYNDFFPHTNSI